MSVSEVRRDIARLRARYKVLEQQQFTFVNAMDNNRTDAYERTKPVRNITTVREYMQRCNNATEKRAFRQWLDYLRDLDDLRRKIDDAGKVNGPMERAMDKWKVLLNPNNDFSSLRARYPHQEVNHLSCDEARNYYGGAVSLIPAIFDCIDAAQGQIAAQAALGTWPPAPAPQTLIRRSSGSAQHRRSRTEGDLIRSQSAMDKAVGTKDFTTTEKKTTTITTKQPRKLSGGVGYYRRTLNGRADQVQLKNLNKKGVWRGASYDKVNHVDHHHFIGLSGSYM